MGVHEKADVLLADKVKITVLPEGTVTSPRGFYAGGLHCGIKRKKLDLGWLYSEIPAVAAAVYTTNVFQAAPLIVTQESIAVEKKIQGVLINSGNANACTGKKGLADAKEMRHAFAQKMGFEDYHVAVVSTGVIGEHLPMDRIHAGIDGIHPNHELATVSDFEQAILTTDTCTKHIAVQLQIDGKTVTIGGAAKGSGMIHPNMATMLGFITTDANIGEEDLQLALRQVTNRSFNMITVDGDTSTNDMVLLLANGLSGNEALSVHHPEWNVFVRALEVVSQELAKKIARDGEGATKLIEVLVQGAINDEAAAAVGKSIIGSSLVKTAIFGTDANWGRIVCAVGYSGTYIDPDKVKVSLGPILVVEDGLPVPFSEEVAKDYLSNEFVQIYVDLQLGEGKAIAWGCDLSYDYVRINASYRT